MSSDDAKLFPDFLGFKYHTFSTVWCDRGFNLSNTDLVDKKGMEYMKERITHEKPGHQKIIREPKKLEHGWDQS